MNKFTEAQQKFFDKLLPGQKYNGKVVNITRYGAFVNIGMINGLVATKDIAWGRIDDPEEVIKLRQKVEVVILKKDEQKQHVSFGIKQLLVNPWDAARGKYNVGDTVIGEVVDVQPYGAFLQIKSGFEGLLHVSKTSGEDATQITADTFEIGQAYEVTIVKLDFEKRELELSLK